jgi:amidase
MTQARMPAGFPAAGELWRWDAADLARAIRLRVVSSREAAQSCLARHAAVGAAINAVFEVDPARVLADADAADAALARGDPPGLLHGVPVTIKENVDQAGFATVNGVEAFRDAIAQHDSPVAANLKRAGAIVLGRSNTPAFSIRYLTDNAVRGRTLNPWSAAHTPGGSSGGASAAVAAGIGALAHGNDYCGSIRYPSYCCGVAGIRPTLGRVPAFNPGAGAERPPSAQLMSVQGPLARRVRDLRLGLAAMAARDARDPWWTPAPLEGPPPARPIRAALVGSIPGLKIDSAVAQAVADAGRALAEAGYAVEEPVAPPLLEPGLLGWSIATQDIRTFMGKQVLELADEGCRRAATLYMEATAELTPLDYATALAERARYLREWILFLETYPVAVLPVSARPPMTYGFDTADVGETRMLSAAQSPMIAVNYIGLPSAAVPTGTVPAPGAARGVPIGVQIVAGRYREDLALDAAEAVEARYPMPTPIDPAA